MAALASGCAGAGAEAEAELRPGTLDLAFVRSTRDERDRRILRGARIAVAEINALGGIDGVLRLRVTPWERLGRPSAALMLPCAPAKHGAVALGVRSRRVLVIAPCGFRRPQAAAGPRIWPVAPSSEAQAAKLADRMADDGHRSAWVVASRSSSFARSFVRLWRARGLRVTGWSEPHARAVDVVGADALVVDVAAEAARTVIRALTATGDGDSVYGTNRLDNDELVRPPAVEMEGLTFVTFGYPDPGSKLDEVYERYRAEFGVRPEASDVALGYTAVKVLEAAINEYESIRPARIRAAMTRMEAKGPLGSVSYSSSGDSSGLEPVLVTVRDGRFERVPDP